MTLQYDIFETPLGWVGLLASPGGLRRTTLPKDSPAECMADLGPEADNASLSPERFTDLKLKLISYLEHEPVSFDDEPIDVDDATPFLRAAWDACRTIPRGETRSYQWLAAQAGNPRASRAAGQSMARNRLPLIIPCHRVIGSDGGLHGFGKGTSALDLKQSLLTLEDEGAYGAR
ncbi:MAG: methylated-DNA--[protein]-cysteine S-methyltransferase [SAR202 cluster bacterium]|jgi:methylated-DNA-[protein]-cysteine S-methyltransferase|nr:methylated-DNA--[protein]-cysteine S-methyltransferase [SAR202 cluster bacterium]